MTRMEAMKKFFGTEKPVVNSELLDLKKADPKGFEEIGDLCLKALGETLSSAK